MLSNQQLQKEQFQIVKISAEIENVMSKINDALNQLKVEELTLKSSILEKTANSEQNYDITNSGLSSYWTLTEPNTQKTEDDFNVNDQELMLDMILNGPDMGEEVDSD